MRLVARSAPAHRHQRRLLALMQLLLFVFSTSTSLLPCASMDGKAMASTTADAPGMVGHDMAMPMHIAMTLPTDDAFATTDAATTDAPPHHADPHHAPGRPMSPSTCPWVIGCGGVLSFAVDASWHAVEHAVPDATPVGATLRAVFADRDIELRPPRA